MSGRQPVEAPDRPSACSRCDTPYGLTLQSVRGADLPFCQTCWNRVEIARRLRLVALVFCAVALLGGTILWWATGRTAPLTVALGVALGALLVALLCSRSPRAKA